MGFLRVQKRGGSARNSDQFELLVFGDRVRRGARLVVARVRHVLLHRTTFEYEKSEINIC